MRISDWSSDVCSSDLHPQLIPRLRYAPARKGRGFGPPLIHETSKMTGKTRIWFNRGFSLAPIAGLMRAADPTLDVFVSVSQQSVHYTGPTETWIDGGDLEPEDRKSVGSGKSVAVRVNLGGRGRIKK